MEETHYSWPTVDEVKKYRGEVRIFVLNMIEKLTPNVCWEGDMWVILMGIEHERIHLETSAVIIRQLPK